MAALVQKIWFAGESGIVLKLVKRPGRTNEPRVHIVGKRGEVISINLDDLFDLTETLDNICDEIEDKETANA